MHYYQKNWRTINCTKVIEFFGRLKFKKANSVNQYDLEVNKSLPIGPIKLLLRIWM